MQIAGIQKHGSVYRDEAGAIWYVPTNSAHPAELLAESDDVCGIWLFETGIDDPFRDVCAFHDRAYSNRAFFEDRGWDRASLDSYFHNLCLDKAGEDCLLIVRADVYYELVRRLGWIPYYRHPAGTPPKKSLVHASNPFNAECVAKLRSFEDEA